MRCAHIAALACALAAVPASRADIILVSGAVTNFDSQDPTLSGLPRPAAFSAVGDFTPIFYDQYGAHGRIAWTITLGGVTLTNALPSGDPGAYYPSDGLNFVDVGASHIYAFGTTLVSASDPTVSTYIEASVGLAPPFAFIPPPPLPPGQNISDAYRAFLISDLRVGDVLPGTGTLTFTRGDGTYFTSLNGTITHLEYIAPEPATLGMVLVGAAVLARGWTRGVRPRCADAETTGGSRNNLIR